MLKDATEYVSYLQDWRLKMRGGCIMIITASLSKDGIVTEDMKREIEEAKKMPITYDEDSPEMTPEMETQFKVAARMRNRLLGKKEA
jgi:hypothetical protein